MSGGIAAHILNLRLVVKPGKETSLPSSSALPLFYTHTSTTMAGLLVTLALAEGSQQAR
jgi:hypothetical protein